MPPSPSPRVSPFWTRHLAPALLPWATAVVFLVAWMRHPSPFHEYMARLMELEFLALHAGAFIGLLAIYHPTPAYSRVLRWLGLVVFASLYLWAGYTVLGWSGLGTMVAMLLGTWGGVLWASRATRFRRCVEFGLRWFLAFLAFAILGAVTGMPESVNDWYMEPHAPLFGALYFLVLGLLELSGLYRLIREW